MADYTQTHWAECWRDGSLREHAECARRHAVEAEQEIERLKALVAYAHHSIKTTDVLRLRGQNPLLPTSGMERQVWDELDHELKGICAEVIEKLQAHEDQQR